MPFAPRAKSKRKQNKHLTGARYGFVKHYDHKHWHLHKHANGRFGQLDVKARPMQELHVACAACRLRAMRAAVTEELLLGGFR